MSSAMIFIVGDELLHGEIEDVNGPWLLQQLNRRGIDVRRLCLLPDDPGVIAEQIRRHADETYLLVTGGLGPTHDDCTREGVARGTGRKLVDHPGVLRRLRERHGADPGEGLLDMARLPRDAELIRLDEGPGMAFRVENVYVFPGIPGLLKPLFRRMEEAFEKAPRFTETLTVHAWESEIAPRLNRLQERFSDLQFGSYPHDDGTLSLKVRGRDRGVLEDAYEAMRETFREESEPGSGRFDRG